MAYICTLPNGSCKSCSHYRFNNEDQRYECYAVVDKEANMKNFEQMCEEINKIRGAAVYGKMNDGFNEAYVELAMITNENINMACQIIKKYGYRITEEGTCSGSDYYSYCIWFNKESKNNED